MKKLLTTAMVLGSLMSVANAMDTITSPLYMPMHGDTLTETKLGYVDEDFKYDRYVGTANDYNADKTAWTLKENISYGIRDDWKLTFGFVYDFAQDREHDSATDTLDKDFDDDEQFRNVNLGLEKRFIDDTFKLDGLLKAYMRSNQESRDENDNSFVASEYTDSNYTYHREEFELAARAGFEVLDVYDTALTLGVTYVPEYNYEDKINAVETDKEVDNQVNLFAKWENQFNPIVGFDFGFNVEYRKIDEYKETQEVGNVLQTGVTNSFLVEDFGIWTLDGDISYIISDNIVLGAYVEYKNYEDANTYQLTAAGATQTAPYATDKDRDSLEYGVKTSVKF